MARRDGSRSPDRSDEPKPPHVTEESCSKCSGRGGYVGDCPKCEGNGCIECTTGRVWLTCDKCGGDGLKK